MSGKSSACVDSNNMLAAIRYGADKVFRGDGATITVDVIDAIINRGKEKTAAMKKVLEEKAQGDMLDFKLEYSTSLQEFGVRKEEKKKEQDFLSLSCLMAHAQPHPCIFIFFQYFLFFFLDHFVLGCGLFRRKKKNRRTKKTRCFDVCIDNG